MKEHREGGWWQTGLNTVPNLDRYYKFWYELVIPLYKKNGLIVAFPVIFYKLNSHKLPRLVFGSPVSWLITVDPRAEEKNRCLSSIEPEEFLRCEK